MIKQLKNKKEFDELIKQGEVLIDFSAEWCGPCKMMEPHLEKLSENYPKLTIVSINVDKFPELAANYQITSIPTLIYYQNGKLVKTSIGYLPYPQLEKIIK